MILEYDLFFDGDADIDLEVDGGENESLEMEEVIIQRHYDTEPYEGEYSVTPDFEGRTLSTAGLRMTADVEVNPIQVERVTNLSGGYTVYIGGDINA